MPQAGVHRRRLISPLTVRILLINLLALVMLVGGVLYLNKFRDNLMQRRIEVLMVQAEIIAGALGESVSEEDSGPEEIDQKKAQQILSRLVSPTENRARLFDPDGALNVDSISLDNARNLLATPLPDIDAEASISEIFEEKLFAFLDFWSPKPDVPPYAEKAGQRADDYLEVVAAMEGSNSYQVRSLNGNTLVINIAVPVQRFRRVLGVLLLTATTEDIERIIRQEQLDTLKTFAATMAVTFLMSIFLARTVVAPVRTLARASEQVRRAIGREKGMPEFSYREDEIGDLSRSLGAMTRALYNQIDAIEHFAADVAHELKNPLASMRGAVETIRMTDKPEIQEKLLAILEDDVKRLDRLITDISDASRLDAELSRGQMAPVDVSAMLAMLIDAYSVTAKDDQPSISLQSSLDGPAMVMGIDARLSQVWRNLLDNAISFSPKGGAIVVRVKRADDNLHIEILDDGPGIPDGAEEKIFSRFYSERPDAEKFGNHSGLGLAISRQIIEAHDGMIDVTNRTDQSGACFTVCLPLDR